MSRDINQFEISGHRATRYNERVKWVIRIVYAAALVACVGLLCLLAWGLLVMWLIIFQTLGEVL